LQDRVKRKRSRYERASYCIIRAGDDRASAFLYLRLGNTAIHAGRHFWNHSSWKKGFESNGYFRLTPRLVDPLISVSFAAHPEKIFEQTTKRPTYRKEIKPAQTSDNSHPKVKIEQRFSYIKVSSLNIWNPSEDWDIILGVVKNAGKQALNQITMQITFFDKEGNIIDRKYEKIFYDVPPFILYPDEAAPFSLKFSVWSGDLPPRSWRTCELSVKDVTPAGKKGIRKWNPDNVELKWSSIEKKKGLYHIHHIVRGEFANRGHGNIDYPGIGIRVYGYDKNGKLTAAKTRGHFC
jgi:hypothetical protein